MPLLGSMARVLCDSWARARSAKSYYKRKVLVSPMRVLSKGHIKHTGAGKHGRLLTIRTVGKVISGTFICL